MNIVTNNAQTNQIRNFIDLSEDVQPIEDCSTSSIKEKNKDLVEHLQKWAVQFNVSHACANEMLKILRSTGLQVPKDIRTILHKYKVIRPIIEIENGSYLNLGIYNIVQPH
ncbi:uncharacterized protein LOC112681527 [Sipha flava]|uniref:Uncharacterized protein LOC112681527 n=1 Tax=Sipha flava TaxID=143950 RepID=A0A8B8FB48_9HEMI|nr:uncharacterized protein LOC112681527 [Sipha flava]